MAFKIKTYIKSLQFGFLSYSSFLLCILSGIALAYVYKPSSPLDSLNILFLLNKAGLYLRSVHYWSTQFFLLTTLFHIIDHQLKKTERDQSAGSWLYLVLLVPIIFFAAFSGFLLKGDYDSSQALSIFRSIIGRFPFIGNSLDILITGKTDSYSVLWFHHVFSATIIIWILTIYHSKKYVTNAKTFLQIIFPVFILSLIFIPGLTGESDLAKGPWYFAGLQEILHFVSWPLFVIIMIIVILGAIYSLRFFPEKKSKYLKITLAVITLIYIALGIDFIFFRGQDWKFGFSTDNINSFFSFSGSSEYLASDTLVRTDQIPLINGRHESCMVCHGDMKGLSKSHDISATGCYSCHLGNPLSLNKVVAHNGMTLTPANFSVISKTCGRSECHADIHRRVKNSIMNTMSGIVSVDKFTFGEIYKPDGHFDISNIGFSPAEKHLRELCASCHFGNEKSEPGPVNELSRGGGCSACHLDYGNGALNDYLLRNKNKSLKSLNHPAISLNVSDKNCFGCHSRSGRISTNYEGWHETSLPENSFSTLSKTNYRLLEDGRIFEKKDDDVHHKAGMNCTDCHLAQEIMGDGTLYSHKEHAIKIACEDCHTEKPLSVKYSGLDAESKKILKLRGPTDSSVVYLKSSKSGLPYLNSFLKDGQIVIKSKFTNIDLIAKQPSTSCGRSIDRHKRLDCITCHTTWTPQCISCHTQYENSKQGWDYLANKNTNYSWIETPGKYLAEYPTLGVIQSEKGEKVTTFVPGMILTIKDDFNHQLFKRLFAPAFSHTINKNATTCKTCHNNPVVLGVGRGKLEYNSKNKNISLSDWSFVPDYLKRKEDGLPQDAWTSFLGNNPVGGSTRPGTRAFNNYEQSKILNVGQCFTCHKENDPRLLKAFSKKNYYDFLSKKCRVFIVK